MFFWPDMTCQHQMSVAQCSDEFKVNILVSFSINIVGIFLEAGVGRVFGDPKCLSLTTWHLAVTQGLQEGTQLGK